MLGTIHGFTPTRIAQRDARIIRSFMQKSEDCANKSQMVLCKKLNLQVVMVKLLVVYNNAGITLGFLLSLRAVLPNTKMIWCCRLLSFVHDKSQTEERETGSQGPRRISYMQACTVPRSASMCCAHTFFRVGTTVSPSFTTPSSVFITPVAPLHYITRHSISTIVVNGANCAVSI